MIKKWLPRLVGAVLPGLFLSTCGVPDSGSKLVEVASGSPAAEVFIEDLTSLDKIAEAYLKLVLAVGLHDKGYVHSYYATDEWQQEVAAWHPPLAKIRRLAASIVAQLEVLPENSPTDDKLISYRRRFLQRQLEALMDRVDMLTGVRQWSFDEESRRLFGTVIPSYGEEQFQTILDEMDRLLSDQGLTEGTLAERYEAFRQDFVIAPQRLTEVLRIAIDACRSRVAAHIELPAGENFVVQYVSDKPWSGHTLYRGRFHSLATINTDLPVYIDRAIDLACREGYSGHHLHDALLEKHLVEDRGWVEYTVRPRYSPQSLIAEGSAHFGIEMAFPGDERQRFERDVLFAVAGLDPARADAYHAVLKWVAELGYANVEAARRYLNGDFDTAAAIEWLTRYAAMEPNRAKKQVRFFDTYRSYVISYYLGRDRVRRYVDARAGAGGSEARWRVFAELLSSPHLQLDLE